ncbi:hypothetical protein JY97_16940 [Alkalispirochaeta odontotermitis]|nr:hypothetical protein JY97_16940 [Alkalispirochaeta odontotermitis]
MGIGLLDFGLRNADWGLKKPVLGIGCWVPGIGYLMLDAGLFDCGMRIADWGLERPVFGERRWVES